MATKKSQRIGIWIIAITMTVGTIGGFIAMVVAPGNQQRDQEAFEAQSEQYNQEMAEYNKKLNAQAKKLSGKYYKQFSSYKSQVGKFDAKSIKELKTKDLKVGKGKEVKEDTKLAVYYIGWNPKGEIFDQSINGKELKAPFKIDGPAKAQVITGWQEGLVGMKIGGVRLLSIPADKAYGESGQGDKISANTPLKFVVMVTEQPEEIPQPEMPPLVKQYYERLYRQYGIEQ